MSRTGICLLLSLAQAYYQLTSSVYTTAVSSSPLHFLSSGDELYAVPTLESYSILVWIQINDPLSVNSAVLALSIDGVLAVDIGWESRWKGLWAI